MQDADNSRDDQNSKGTEKVNLLKKVTIFHSPDECQQEVQRLKRLQQQYPLCPDVIPSELADLDQWVVWSYGVLPWQNRRFGVNKMPYQAKNPNLKAARTVPPDWSDLETALRCAENNQHIDGIGFVFSKEDGLSGVDFDNCRNPKTGHIREEYQFWIDKLRGYAEVSPSGTGVKVWVKGTIADKYFNTEESTGFRILKFAGGEIEVYRRGQYFAVTTQCLKNVKFITSAQTELDIFGEWSLSEISRGIPYSWSSGPVSTNEDAVREFLESYWDEKSSKTNIGDVEELGVQPISQTIPNSRDPRCSRCGKKCYQYYELCYECYNDGVPEVRVEDAVFDYFSKFSGFSIKRQHEIRIGTYTPRPDVVLLDQQGNLAAIAECKRGGIVGYGIDQLKSYLTASDVQFGIFANSTQPSEWIFFENLREQRFKEDVPIAQFEEKIVADRPIESIREEKDRFITEIEQIRAQYVQKTRELESSCKRLEDLNQKISQANDRVADLKEKIDSLKEERNDLTEKVTHDSQQAEVLEGLKLVSTHNNLKEVIHSLMNQRDQLQNEIGEKEQQHIDLSEGVNLLQEDKDKLERERNRIRSERETLRSEKEIWRDTEKERKNFNYYLKQINADLEKSIKHKIGAIRDLDRLSRLDELEAKFAQESIYEQNREKLERLDKLESEIKSKQQLAEQDQERHAACERNRVETNQKVQQLTQVSQDREFTLKQLREVVNRLKTASPEQKPQIEVNRKQLVQDLRKRKSICVQLIEKISQLREAKPKLEEEIMQEDHQLPGEKIEMSPAYVRIQLEIDNLKAEKSMVEAEIGHRIFLLLF